MAGTQDIESSPTTAGEPTVSETNKTYDAPNIIVNWAHLKEVLDDNLGPCKICKGNNRTITKTRPICFAVSLEIHCPECDKNKSQSYNQINMEPRDLRICNGIQKGTNLNIKRHKWRCTISVADCMTSKGEGFSHRYRLRSSRENTPSGTRSTLEPYLPLSISAQVATILSQ